MSETPEPETFDNSAIQRKQQELKTLAESAEFGTPQFEAISDWFDLRELYNELSSDHKKVLGSKEGSSEWIASESLTRVAEVKVALLEHAISQNRSRVEGYSGAYSAINDGVDELAHEVGYYAGVLFKDKHDKKQEATYRKETMNEMIDGIQQAFGAKKE